MKHLLCLLVCVLPTLGFAQQTKLSISESSSNQRYSLRVQSSDFTEAQLINAFNEVSGNGLSESSRGTFSWTNDEGVEVEINTRRGTFTVQGEHSASGRKLGLIAKRALNIKPPPPPPAPPVID